MQTEATKSSAKQQKQNNDKASVPLRVTSGNKNSLNCEAIVPPRAATSASNNSVSGGLNESSVLKEDLLGKMICHCLRIYNLLW